MDPAIRLNLVRALLESHQSECEMLVDEALAELDSDSLEAIAAGYPIDPLHLKLCRLRGMTFDQCLAEIVESHRRMAELDAARRTSMIARYHCSAPKSLAPRNFE
jgi:hypothetical protein